jgi:hypothetical protein
VDSTATTSRDTASPASPTLPADIREAIVQCLTRAVFDDLQQEVAAPQDVTGATVESPADVNAPRARQDDDSATRTD